MEVFRLTTAKYANDLSGTGARLHGGRWNQKGDAVLYTSGSRALAMVEVLVHLTNAFLPLNYQLITIYIPDDSILAFPLKSLPKDWKSIEPNESTKKIVAKWLVENEYLALKVPSVVVEGEHNYLLNPLHADFLKVKVLKVESFSFDDRLIK
jgi:RES domain-containing protein